MNSARELINCLNLEPHPEGGYFKHTYEGLDDMTAHVKSSLLGVQLSIPVNEGRLAMGTWQGIYLGEHREDGGGRRILATLQGDG